MAGVDDDDNDDDAVTTSFVHRTMQACRPVDPALCGPGRMTTLGGGGGGGCDDGDDGGGGGGWDGPAASTGVDADDEASRPKEPSGEESVAFPVAFSANAVCRLAVRGVPSSSAAAAAASAAAAAVPFRPNRSEAVEWGRSYRQSRRGDEGGRSW